MYEYHYEILRIFQIHEHKTEVTNRLNELGSQRWKLVGTHVENNQVYMFFIRKLKEDVVLLEEQEANYKGLTQ